jgi:pyruvate dehydrogenase E2 component (dihydrolipoamide acetyltransferase)
MSDFRMPSLGADMVQGTVLEWRVAPGDRVERGDVVAVVDTEKAAIEVEIFESGVVEELLVEAGSRVPVGTVLARVREDGVEPAPLVEQPAASGAPGGAEEPSVEEPPADAAPAAVPPPVSEAYRPAASVPTAPEAPPALPGRLRASPAARALAAERGIDLVDLEGSGPDGAILRGDVEAVAAPPTHPEPAAVPSKARPLVVTPVAGRAAVDLGVDLTRVEGTGPDGAITRGDVERAAGRAGTPASPAPVAPPPPSAAAERPEPATTDRQAAMRQAIAAAVTRSKREIPHYYLSTRIDMTRALAWLDAENRERPMAERILPAALTLKATSLALRDYPELNGFWEDDAFRHGEAIHLGVIVFLREGGLVAPAIREADGRTLDELMLALTDLVRRARSGGLRSSELTSATVTVTNLGERGVESVFGVIYPPQVAIVGFGRIAEEPWAEGGTVGARPVLTATLAADHRASDGHRGGLFLSAVNQLLQTPEAL